MSTGAPVTDISAVGDAVSMAGLQSSKSPSRVSGSGTAAPGAATASEAIHIGFRHVNCDSGLLTEQDPWLEAMVKVGTLRTEACGLAPVA